MMRPENATTDQQYKQTYAPGYPEWVLRGETVNSNVFSVSTWQQPSICENWGPLRGEQCPVPLLLRWTKSRKPHK